MELLIALPKAIMIPLGILFLILALFIGGIFTVMGATLLFSKEQDTLFWHRICGLAILIYGIDIIIMDTLWFLHRCLGGNTTWWSESRMDFLVLPLIPFVLGSILILAYHLVKKLVGKIKSE